MNFNDNASVMKDISPGIGSGTKGVMHPTAAGMSPTSHSPALHALHGSSYNTYSYDNNTTLPSVYTVESIISNPTSATSSLPFGVVSDITPSFFSPRLFETHSYSTPPHQLQMPQQATPDLLDYAQPGIQSHLQRHLFPSPAPYAPSLPLPSNQNAGHYFLSTSTPVMPRFPELHDGIQSTGTSPLSGYGASADPPFLPPLMAGAQSDRKTVVQPSPQRNSLAGSESEGREANTRGKKRRACGNCGPCQLKENCGDCLNCLNRAKGKQICVHRKCEILKKKPGANPPYASTPADAIPNQEQAKDIGEFTPVTPKRSKLDSATIELPAGLGHPTLHPNFHEFGDLNRSSFRSHSANFQQEIPVQQDFGNQRSYMSGLHGQPFSYPTSTTVIAQQNSNIHSTVDQSLNIAGQEAFGNQDLHVFDFKNTYTGSTVSVSNNRRYSSGSQHLTSRKPDPNLASEYQPLVGNLPLQPPQPAPNLIQRTTVNSGDSELNCRLRQQATYHNPGSIISSPSYAGVQDRRQFSFDSQTKPENSMKEAASYSKTQANNSTANTATTVETGQANMYQPGVAPYVGLNESSNLDPSIGLSQEPYQRNCGYATVNATHLASPSNSNLFRQLSGREMQVGDVKQPIQPASDPHFSLNNNNSGQRSLLPSISNINASFPSSYHYNTTNIPQMSGHYNLGPNMRLNPQHRYPSYVTTQQVPSNSMPHAEQVVKPSLLSEESNMQIVHHQRQTHRVPGNMGMTVGHRRSVDCDVLQPGLSQNSVYINQHPKSRHLSIQSTGNLSGGHSPMMQASPAAIQGTARHSPFAGPTNSSLRSPVSNLIASSPASQVQGIMNSPTAVNHSPNVSRIVGQNTLLNVDLSSESNKPPTHHSNTQACPSWHEQPNLGSRTSTNFHNQGPNSQSVTQSYTQNPNLSVPPQSVTNHFLAKPGSSLKSLDSHVSNYQRPSKAAPQRDNSMEGYSVGNPSFAAARLTEANHHTKTEKLMKELGEHNALKESNTTCLYSLPSSIELEDFGKSPKTLLPNDAHATISPGESGYDSSDFNCLAGESVYGCNGANSSEQGTTVLTDDTNDQSKDLQANFDESLNEQLLQIEVQSMNPLCKGSLVELSSLHANASSSLGIQMHSKSTNLPRDRKDANHNSRVFSVDSRLEDVGDDVHFKHTASTVRRINSIPMDRKTTKLMATVHKRPAMRQASHNQKETPVPKQKYSPIKSLPMDTYSQPYLCSYEEKPVVSEREHFHNNSNTHNAMQWNHKEIPIPAKFHEPNVLSEDGSCHGLTSDDLRGRVRICKAENGTITKETVFPQCNCLAGLDQVEDDAPYYTHLGTAPNLVELKKLFELRTGYVGKAVRIEKVIFTGKEGKTKRGCPIAKWILRRESEEEKVLILCRRRPGHHCATTFITIVILLWEGVRRPFADFAYSKCSEIIPQHGEATERQCGINQGRTCACQGYNNKNGGASFSFGCSWTMFYDTCKYARSSTPNKFKLTGTKDPKAERFIGSLFNKLASIVGGVYKQAAPDAHRNQTEYEKEGYECRLGNNSDEEGRPFSGVTCCMDFCAHSHKDHHNMDNGTTIVLTVTKPANREIGKKPADEQLHVLPLYRLDLTNEDKSDESLHRIREKINNGSIEILNGFRREIRTWEKALGNAKNRKEEQKRQKQKRRQNADCVSASKKKRGRQPKRSLSMEDCSVASGTSTAERLEDKITTKACRNEVRRNSLNEVSNHVPSYLRLNLPNPVSSPPPRWPYRRHVPNDDSHQLPSPSPGLNSHLPSIGSFFNPEHNVNNQHSTVGLTPATPLNPQFPNPCPSLPSFQFGRRLSTASQDAFSEMSNQQTETLDQSQTEGSIPLPTSSTVSKHPQHATHYKMASQMITDPATYNSHNNQHPSNLVHPVNQSVNNVEPTELPKSLPSEHPLDQLAPQVKREVYSDSEDSFKDHNIGGVAIAPGHGSILIECAKREVHATTSLLKPDRFNPCRLSLVFYQHKNMNYRNHGKAEYEIKEAKKAKEKAKEQEAQAKAAALSSSETAVFNESNFNAFLHPDSQPTHSSSTNHQQSCVEKFSTVPPKTALMYYTPRAGMSSFRPRACFPSVQSFGPRFIPGSVKVETNRANETIQNKFPFNLSQNQVSSPGLYGSNTTQPYIQTPQFFSKLKPANPVYPNNPAVSGNPNVRPHPIPSGVLPRRSFTPQSNVTRPLGVNSPMSSQLSSHGQNCGNNVSFDQNNQPWRIVSTPNVHGNVAEPVTFHPCLNTPSAAPYFEQVGIGQSSATPYSQPHASQDPMNYEL